MVPFISNFLLFLYIGRMYGGRHRLLLIGSHKKKLNCSPKLVSLSDFVHFFVDISSFQTKLTNAILVDTHLFSSYSCGISRAIYSVFVALTLFILLPIPPIYFIAPSTPIFFAWVIYFLLGIFAECINAYFIYFVCWLIVYLLRLFCVCLSCHFPISIIHCIRLMLHFSYIVYLYCGLIRFFRLLFNVCHYPLHSQHILHNLQLVPHCFWPVQNQKLHCVCYIIPPPHFECKNHALSQ